MAIGICGYHGNIMCHKCYRCVDCGKQRCKCYDELIPKKTQELGALFCTLRKELKKRGIIINEPQKTDGA